MADPPMQAAGARGSGGGATPKRRASDRDPPADLKTEILEAARRLDGATARKLDEKLDKQHAEVLAAIGMLAAAQEAHSAWIQARDGEREQDAILRHNQEQRDIGQAELRAEDEKKKRDQRQRWKPITPVILGTIATVAAAEFIGLLENLEHLSWNARTQGIAVSMGLMAIVAYVILRYGP